MATSTRPLRPPIRDTAAAMLVALVSAVVLYFIAPDAVADLDGARDLLIASDCVERGACHTMGAPGGFGGFHPGGLWTGLLAAARIAGLALHGVHVITLALATAGAVLVARVHARVGRIPGSETAAALTVFAGACFTSFPHLWAPSVVPLAASLFWCLLAIGAATGSAGVFVGTGAALALVVNGHPVGLALVPLLVAAISGTSPRPLTALAGAMIAVALTTVGLSPGFVAVNGAALLKFLPVLGSVSAAGAIVGVVARRRMRALSPASRARLTVLLGGAVYAIAVTAASRGFHQPLVPRYFAPIAPPVAVALAAMLSVPVHALTVRARLPLQVAARIATSVLTMALGARSVVRLTDFPLRTSPAQWRWTEVEELARALREQHVDWKYLFAHLRGPGAHPLLSSLAAVGLRDDAHSFEAPVDLLIVRSSEALPRDPSHACDDLQFSDGMHAALCRITAYLDVSTVQVCARSSTEDPECTSANLTPVDARSPRAERYSYPRLESLEHFPTHPTTNEIAVTYWFDVRIPGNGPDHIVQLLRDDAPGSIAEVDGVPFHWIREGQSLVLSGDRAASGRIAFRTRATARGGTFRRWFPAYAESLAGQTELQRRMTGDGR